MKTSLLVILFIAFFVRAENTDSAGHNNPYKNKDIQGCYNEGVSTYIDACMTYLQRLNEQKYNEYYKGFQGKMKKSKGDFINYADFFLAIEKEKESWDSYIHYRCTAQRNLFEKNNYAANIIFNDCLIRGYQERIEYYSDYKFY